jgi:hypothetical protein
MIDNSRVRFKNNKPYLIKKIFVTVFVIAIVLYFAINMHWITNFFLLMFTGIPLLIKISKQPSEGKGFFGKLVNFYKNMYKNYIIDILPVNAEISENKVSLSLQKAEYINFHLVDESFMIEKDDVAGVLFDEEGDDVLIMFQTAQIVAFDSNTGNIVRKTKQHNSTICFSLNGNTKIVEDFTKFGYPIEKLSEIEDAEQEERDPELLVNKLFAQYEEAKKATADATEKTTSADDMETKNKQEVKVS